VYSLGRRNRPWALNVNWEPFAEREGNRLYYESNFIGPGHSGGAFLDEDLLLVGMIRSDQPPNGEAVSITSILDRVRQWRYPVRLTRPTLPAAFASLAVGSDHTCGLTADGAAYCWGLNGGGALGTGVFGGRSKRVMGRLRFRSLSAASGMTCGVTTDDAAYCWGLAIWNSEAGADNRQLTPTPVPGGRRFRSVSVGDNHVCGLAPDGSAFCWGENELGQLGNGSRGKSVTPVPVAGNLKFKSISVGENHNCALTGDGIAYCWGQNLNGEVGVGSIRMVVSPVAVAGDLRFSSISASPTGHTCGVAITGQAYCWGLARSGALGNGSGGDTETNSLTPSAVAGALTFASLTTGAWYSCGIVTTGATYCWGNNEDGQLGNGGTEGSRAPVETAGKLRFASLSTSSFYGKLICGLTTQGAPYCWGRTDEQQQVGAAFPNDVAVRVPTAVRP
jgi:alpha-tubulin suppressor-like RCC1 family protein